MVLELWLKVDQLFFSWWINCSAWNIPTHSLHAKFKFFLSTQNHCYLDRLCETILWQEVHFIRESRMRYVPVCTYYRVCNTATYWQHGQRRYHLLQRPDRPAIIQAGEALSWWVGWGVTPEFWNPTLCNNTCMSQRNKVVIWTSYQGDEPHLDHYRGTGATLKQHTHSNILIAIAIL